MARILSIKPTWVSSITVGVGPGKARRLRTRVRSTVTFLLVRTVAGLMARFPAVKAGVFMDVLLATGGSLHLLAQHGQKSLEVRAELHHSGIVEMLAKSTTHF